MGREGGTNLSRPVIITKPTLHWSVMDKSHFSHPFILQLVVNFVKRKNTLLLRWVMIYNVQLSPHLKVRNVLY